MTTIETEAGGGLDRGADRCERLVVDVIDAPASLADEVGRDVVREVVHGSAVVEVHVADHAEIGQGVQRSVDGRQVDLGRSGTDALGHVVGSGMRLSIDERFEDEAALVRDTATCAT